MGVTGGGVWKTENMGITWRNISDGYLQDRLGGRHRGRRRPIRTWCTSAWASTPPAGVMTSSGRRGVSLHRRGEDLEEDRPRRVAAHRAHRRRPEEPRRGVRRGAGRALRAVEAARRLQVHRRRSHLEERPLCGREDRRRRAVHGRQQPAHPVRGDVGAWTAPLEGDQRRPRQRTLQVHRCRRDLAEDDAGTSREDGEDGDRGQPVESGEGLRPDRGRLLQSAPRPLHVRATPARAGARCRATTGWCSGPGTTSRSSSTRRTRTGSTC